MSKETELLVGIVGVDAHLEGRELPDGVPPPWRENSTLKTVGKPKQRLDGVDKVTGRAHYTADIKRPGLLIGRILRSPHPHARVHGIVMSDAEKMPGVRAVVALPHLLGGAKEEGEDQKNARLVPKVRYAGQPIAAVAAETAAQAEAALLRIKVDFEVLPHVIDPDEAQKPDAPLVFSSQVSMSGSAGGGGGNGPLPQHGNVRGPRRGAPRGKDVQEMQKAVEAAQKHAKTVLRGTYRTQVQTHSALETHGITAEWKGDELTVWASTQGIFSVRDELAEYLGISKSRVHVITEFCGGGFGAKFGAGNYGVLAALLAKKAGAPVRVVLDRHEEHVAVGNRPGSFQDLTLATDDSGKLTAIAVRGFGTGGAGAGAGFAGPATNLYSCPAIYTEEFDIFTHTGPLAAFRAPGHPQGAFAIEQAMDELAEKLGLDPLELRQRNDPHPARRIERQRGAELFGWTRRQPTAKAPPEGALLHIRRGLGMAQGVWYYFFSEDASAEVRIHRDGTVELLTGVQDIGGGIRTPLAQVVAEELGIPLASVKVSLGDTRLPVGPASGGSVTTGSLTPPARDAAFAARRELLKEVAISFGAPAKPVLLHPNPGGGLSVDLGGKLTELSFKQAAARMRKDLVSGTASRQADYGSAKQKVQGTLGGVQFAEVTVDTLTGIIKVERIVAAHDCGRPINPLLTESQIHGGVIQGVSYALFEERRMDYRSGRMLNANFEQYKIAGALDVPRIEVVILEELFGRNSTDARGIGEPATVPTAAAIANAVYNAIGVRIRELPLTPARVLQALAQGAKAAPNSPPLRTTP